MFWIATSVGYCRKLQEDVGKLWSSADRYPVGLHALCGFVYFAAFAKGAK